LLRNTSPQMARTRRTLQQTVSDRCTPHHTTPHHTTNRSNKAHTRQSTRIDSDGRSQKAPLCNSDNDSDGAVFLAKHGVRFTRCFISFLPFRSASSRLVSVPFSFSLVCSEWNGRFGPFPTISAVACCDKSGPIRRGGFSGGGVRYNCNTNGK